MSHTAGQLMLLIERLVASSNAHVSASFGNSADRLASTAAQRDSARAALREACEKLCGALEKSRVLMKALYEVDSAVQKAGIYTFALAHGIKYQGPTYYQEGADVNQAIYELDAHLTKGTA